jgi:hypothetical protein
MAGERKAILEAAAQESLTGDAGHSLKRTRR